MALVIYLISVFILFICALHHQYYLWAEGTLYNFFYTLDGEDTLRGYTLPMLVGVLSFTGFTGLTYCGFVMLS